MFTVGSYEGTKCDLPIPRMRTAYGQKSFAFRRADAWNKFHNDIQGRRGAGGAATPLGVRQPLYIGGAGVRQPPWPYLSRQIK